MPVYALEISEQSYKYIKIQKSGGGFTVTDFGDGEIASGIIEKSEIKKPEALVRLFSEIFSKKHVKFVAVSLPEEKGFLRNIKLTGMQENEIYHALELQLEEHVPVPPAEILFDYELVRKEKDHFDVILKAFHRQLIESYLEVLASAGAIPILAESELSAEANAVIPENFSGVAMIMNFGKTKTGFAITENKNVRFTSAISIGSGDLDEAIAKILKVDKKNAEDLKKKKGFVDNRESLDVFQAMVPIITAIREEAEKYISFWQTHSESQNGPSHLFLAGGGANLIGLAGYLRKELGLTVSLGNPWTNIVFPKYYLPPIEAESAIRFSVPIGLSMLALSKENMI